MSHQEHRYQYDKAVPGHAAKKFKCPQCGHKRYVMFYDFEQNKYLPEQFGKCDREDHCGYVNTPWLWLKENGQDNAERYTIAVNYFEPPKARIVEVEKHILAATLKAYEHNNFYLYLLSIFDKHTADALVATYFIGTAQRLGTIFWQLDSLYRIRTAQKIHYQLDGHRDKSYNPPSQRLFTVDKGYVPCLFGEHLIHDAPKNAIYAVCEAEKTAIICSVYYPLYDSRPLIWLACCGMHGFTDDKLAALAGQDVMLCNDFAYTARATWGSVLMHKKKDEQTGKTIIAEDGEIDYEYISVKAKLEERGCKVWFFDPYPDVEDGSDLADYVVKAQAPVFYTMPDFASLTISERQEIGVEQKKTNHPLDLRTIGQAIEARDQAPQNNHSEQASNMIYERYGYGISSRDFEAKQPRLAKELRLLNDPRVQLLVKRFDLDTKLQF